MRSIFAAGLILAFGSPAAAAIIGQETVAASGGIAELNYGGPLTDPTTIWVGVDRGQITYGAWEHFGYETILSWSPDGGGYDDVTGMFIPGIIGNDYFYAPGCGSSPASPVCDGGPVRTLLHDNVLRQIFLPPPDINRCTPTFTGDTDDCAFFHQFQGFDFDIVAAVASGDVTFTFYDSNPLAGRVPEPASWAMLIAGFGLNGAALRKRRAALPSRANDRGRGGRYASWLRCACRHGPERRG